jgi:glutamate carboxypeptidase
MMRPVAMNISFPELQESLSAFFRRQLPDALALLERWVAINTFTANRAGVDHLGRVTAGAFESLGFQTEFIPSVLPGFGHHVVLTRPGGSPRRIGLISHLDTVFSPEEEASHDFHWRQEGERIYGPGIIDIKGGTLMIHQLLSAMKSIAPVVFDSVTWVVLLNSSEEVLSRDFGQLCLERLPGDALAALVFETGGRLDERFTLVTSRKGRATFRLRVEGRGAHAGSQHHRGANAVVQISEIIRRIADLTDYANDLTFNVGTVSGGTVVNRVPHFASAEIEMRAFSPEVFNAGREALLGLNGQITVRSAEDQFPCRVSIEVAEETVPWPRNEATDRLFDLWREAASPLGFKVLREERGGVSDGNYLWHRLPCIDGLGPCGDNAHCSESSSDGSKQPEHLDVGSVVPKAMLNAMALVRLVAGVG